MDSSEEPEVGCTIEHKQVTIAPIKNNAPLMAQLHSMYIA